MHARARRSRSDLLKEEGDATFQALVWDSDDPAGKPSRPAGGQDSLGGAAPDVAGAAGTLAGGAPRRRSPDDSCDSDVPDCGTRWTGPGSRAGPTRLSDWDDSRPGCGPCWPGPVPGTGPTRPG